MISEIKTSQVAQTAQTTAVKGQASKAAVEEIQEEAVQSTDAVSLGTTKASAGTYGKTSRKLSSTDISSLKAAADQRYESLLKLVEQMLNKQGTASKRASGTVDTDTDSVTEAQKAISEDGEWGVKAVSDRIVQFAVAVSGGDKAKYEELKSAIDKGFQQAAKSLGGELPGISQQTYDEVMRKLDEWKNDESQSA